MGRAEDPGTLEGRRGPRPPPSETLPFPRSRRRNPGQAVPGGTRWKRVFAESFADRHSPQPFPARPRLSGSAHDAAIRPLVGPSQLRRARGLSPDCVASRGRRAARVPLLLGQCHPSARQLWGLAPQRRVAANPSPSTRAAAPIGGEGLLCTVSPAPLKRTHPGRASFPGSGKPCTTGWARRS